MRRDRIVIGTSAGGLKALQQIMRGLPCDLEAAVLVVQHISPSSPSLLAGILRRSSALPVSHARDRERIELGHVYIAPPDHHLLVSGNHMRLTRGPKENLARPAVDPLFRSVAAASGPGVIGVILTGMLDDGTAGLWAVKARGGTTVVQDPKDAMYPSMPRSAIRYVDVDYVCPASEIAPLLSRLTREPIAPREVETLPAKLAVESQISQEDIELQLGVFGARS